MTTDHMSNNEVDNNWFIRKQMIWRDSFLWYNQAISTMIFDAMKMLPSPFHLEQKKKLKRMCEQFPNSKENVT